MDEDKAHEYLSDITAEGGSNCCGASMYEWGDNLICKECKEWCEVEKEDEPQDIAFSTEQLKEIASIEKQCADAGCDGPDHNEHK